MDVYQAHKMKRQGFFALLALIFMTFLPTPVQAEGVEEELLPLCPPGVFYDNTQDCIPLGPTAYLMDMAEKGITFPETPLPIQNHQT